MCCERTGTVHPNNYWNVYAPAGDIRLRAMAHKLCNGASWRLNADRRSWQNCPHNCTSLAQIKFEQKLYTSQKSSTKDTGLPVIDLDCLFQRNRTFKGGA
jgi:hypothetical protein